MTKAVQIGARIRASTLGRMSGGELPKVGTVFVLMPLRQLAYQGTLLPVVWVQPALFEPAHRGLWRRVE